MKIVYLIAGTYNSGGMERVLANKANYLARHGHEVVIVTTEQCRRQPFYPLDKSIVCYDLGIGYEDNNGKSFLNKLLHYPIKQWRHKRQLSRLLGQLKADITISMFCNDAAFLPDIHDGSKKVLEVHFSRFKRLQYGRKGLWKLADKWRSKNDARTVARYDRFVVLTEEDRGYWGNMPNIVVIPNARTFTFSQPSRLDNKTVIAVGRYNSQKGFDRLIDAWGLVCQKTNDWKLEIIGDGELHQELLQQIGGKGLEEKITLRRVQADKMKDVYANASILALSSRYEGLPMVLLEAQAAGLPIVAFACKCGPRDVIEDGVNGFLVNEGDLEGLARQLLYLMEHEATRKDMGKSAYLNSEKYAEEIIMGRWEDLFHELTATAKSVRQTND